MTINHPAPRLRIFLPVVAAILLGCAATHAVQAQPTSAILGEGGPRDQHRGAGPRKGGSASADESDMTPKLKQQPIQRLDAGALLCRTEAALQQHEAAVAARLNGNEAAEPTGCRLVQSMMAVAVVDRHGLAHTQIKAGDQLGWTNAMIRNP